jgi:hypothetical protein
MSGSHARPVVPPLIGCIGSQGCGVIKNGYVQIHTLRITPNFLSIIAEIDEFKGAWRALGSLAPERLSALRRVATIESIGSSTRIEGSRLSDQEVQRLLSNLDIQTFSTRDEEEVVAAQVMGCGDVKTISANYTGTFCGKAARISATGEPGRPRQTRSRLSTRQGGRLASCSRPPPPSTPPAAWLN